MAVTATFSPETISQNLKLVTGSDAVTGSLTVATGLRKVLCCGADAESDLDGSALANVQAEKGDQAGTPAAGSITLKAWKITAADNSALVAASAAKTINWWALGY